MRRGKDSHLHIPPLIHQKDQEGPKNSLGHAIRLPAGAALKDHADNTVRGYAYDGGYMTPAGIPARKIGTPTSPPGDFLLGLGQISYAWISPADPSFDPLNFNFDTDITVKRRVCWIVTSSTSLQPGQNSATERKDHRVHLGRAIQGSIGWLAQSSITGGRQKE